MRLFFAGSDASHKFNEVLLSHDVKNRLESFYYLKGKNPSNGLFENYILDSGGYTARKHNVKIDIGHYIDFLNRHSIKTAFNLDTSDLTETLENQRLLTHYTSAEIMPVYHTTEWMDRKQREILLRYVSDFDYIGIATYKFRDANKRLERQYLDYVFSVIPISKKIHGLGITKESSLYLYPWFSVDSTSWMSMGLHASTINKKIKQMEKFLAKERHYLYNIGNEMPLWIKLEKNVTEYWKLRGVNYE